MLTEILSIIIILLLIVAIVMLVMVLKKKPENIASFDKETALLSQKIEMAGKQNNDSIMALSKQMGTLTEKNYEQQIQLLQMMQQNSEKQTEAVSKAIDGMQKSNEQKLEEMRKTVDEKLQTTLENRLNSSFKTVSEQLSNVYRSLGEMQKLSLGVTDSVSGLNRILTNVKARGTWAEVQLKNILDQTIPNMYEENVQTNKNDTGRVEFAVKIPNKEEGGYTYLPIDSKFPMEDYARLSKCADNGDSAGIEAARKALEARVREEAKTIKKYISLPDTTPFAIMYLATEGLYAEIVSSKSGIAEKIQADGILIAGPSTITAMLNSLAMGFRTLAINEKANEVWKILGVAKAQYEKFGDLLQTAKKRIELAGKALDDADFRNEQIQKKLKNVEALEGEIE